MSELDDKVTAEVRRLIAEYVETEELNAEALREHLNEDGEIDDNDGSYDELSTEQAFEAEQRLAELIGRLAGLFGLPEGLALPVRDEH